MGALPIVTEFVGHPREHTWVRAYADAKAFVEDARSVSIHDAIDVDQRSSPAQGRIGMLLHALRSREVGHASAKARLDDVCQRQVDDGRIALGLASVGPEPSQAAEAVYSHVGDPPHGLQRWIEGVPDAEELRSLMIEWLLTLVDLCGSTPKDGTEAVLAEEMPSTSAGASNPRPRRFRGAI